MVPFPSSLPKAPCHYAGVWSLRTREQPIGDVVERHPLLDCPLWLQTPCGLYADIRSPAPGNGLAINETFAGYCEVQESSEGSIATWHRVLEFQPPSGKPDRGRNMFEGNGEVLIELGHPRNHYREIWHRVAKGDRFAALELVSDNKSRAHQVGYWLFCGDWFLRVVGAPRGSGAIAARCAPSMEAVRSRFGVELVDTELATHWQSVYGRLERPGLLRRWEAGAASSLFLDVSASGTPSVEVRQDKCLVVVHPWAWPHVKASGKEEHWRIVEMDFNPFTS
eukprot:gnl/TRDRNA2_/TRDRNA2_171658_c0_seq2.p1 gnl/TRDRNA2_/TRDRNA2_171658_c0~~gnl/TRDRNA2_/TRDRNA2_171658_c0_seq2.p1  ORF type:complete len:280 (+),score=33.60 gnl/TRDRNA2_/TRDRNA2_171658_c0_seq2:109-948(+)